MTQAWDLQYDDPDPETTAHLEVPPTYRDPATSGVGPLAQADAENRASDAKPVEEEDRELCPTCSRAVPTIRELLNDIFGRLNTRSDEFVIAFYTKVATARPDLIRVGMFPPDLIDPSSTGAGRAQRDRLLHALLAVASLYNPRNPKSMAQLDKALDGMAQTHGESRIYVEDPEWPGGRRQLLQREYDDVNRACVATAREFYGNGWTPLHTAAIWTALTYVADRMGMTQILAAPRHAA